MVKANFRPLGVIFKVVKIFSVFENPDMDLQNPDMDLQNPDMDLQNLDMDLQNPDMDLPNPGLDLEACIWRQLPPMGEAKGPGERTSALHLGTWLYTGIYIYIYTYHVFTWTGVNSKNHNKTTCAMSLRGQETTTLTSLR